MAMKKELFLTVANYSLPENGEQYLESLKNTPQKPVRCYNYALWLYPGLVFKLGQAKFPPGSASQILYDLKAISGEDDRFTESELSGFEQKRQHLINVLDQIVRGKPLSDIEAIGGLLLTASQLTRDDKFNLGSEGIKREEMPLYPWTPKEKRRSTLACVKPEKSGRVKLIYNTLTPVFNLACYGLSAFLADQGQGRLKRCAHCNKFFIRGKEDERIRFCSDDCRNLCKQEQRKTDDGKAQRADYMKKHRADLRERKQAKNRKEELKRLMDSGYTRKQAEKLLSDVEA